MGWMKYERRSNAFKVPTTSSRTTHKEKKTVKVGAKEYKGPIYYCGRCKCYYVHIPGLPSTEKRKEIAPSGMPIYYKSVMDGSILHKPVKKKEKTVKVPQTGAKQNEKNIAPEVIKKKKKPQIKQFTTFCPIHDEKLQSPSLVEVGEAKHQVPIFYCVKCGKYYVNVNCWDGNKILGKLRGKPVANTENQCSYELIRATKEIKRNAVLDEVIWETEVKFTKPIMFKKHDKDEKETKIINQIETEEDFWEENQQHVEVIKMGLNDFTITKERALPIFVLADTSGSMNGEKIQAVNKAIHDMVNTLRNVNDIRGVFKISIIAFGGDKVIVKQHPTDVRDIQLEELTAAGKTPMGEAITVATELIEDKTIVKSNDYLPTVVLLSDGYPTDFPGGKNATFEQYLEWEPIKKMHEGERSKKCMRVAMSVDAGTDMSMLKAFLDNGTEPMLATDADDIAKLFKWVTMSTISRMTSANPDDVKNFLKFDNDDEDEDVIE